MWYKDSDVIINTLLKQPYRDSEQINDYLADSFDDSVSLIHSCSGDFESGV